LRKVFFVVIVAFFFFSVADTKGQGQVTNIPKYDYAQYHFGFTVGLNQMLFTIRPASDLNTRVFTSEQTPEIYVDSSMLLSVHSNPTFGFIIGINGNLRLGRYFDLRLVPDLSFGERNLNYSILGFRGDSTIVVDVKKNVGSVFIDFPLYVKYRSKRQNNKAAYVLAGIQYSLDIASNARKNDLSGQVVVKLNKNDIYALVGAGFDFYNPWFKLGVEVRMAYGLFDMLKRDDFIYTQGIESLKSKVFQLCFTFE
jgi:hypothetical protein